jgi:hypothetical protein
MKYIVQFNKDMMYMIAGDNRSFGRHTDITCATQFNTLNQVGNGLKSCMIDWDEVTVIEVDVTIRELRRIHTPSL